MKRARGTTLLLALVFAVGALSPCAFGRGPALESGGGAGWHAHHAASQGEPPCHAAPAAVVKAPCPCGCSEHPQAATSLGSLGVAILPRAESLPAAARASLAQPQPARFAESEATAVEKVPRAA